MIPLAASLLCLVATFPLGSIVAQLREDTNATKEIARLTEPLPEPRQNLAFPEPVTPMDLPPRWDPAGADWLRAEEFPIVVELYVGGGRHRVGEAPGTDTQRARWNSPTGQFWAIVEFNAALDEPCSHCADPEDGERPHAGCPGCACPCGLIPDGVEGHAIAGGTR